MLGVFDLRGRVFERYTDSRRLLPSGLHREDRKRKQSDREDRKTRKFKVENSNKTDHADLQFDRAAWKAFQPYTFETPFQTAESMIKAVKETRESRPDWNAVDSMQWIQCSGFESNLI